MDTFSGDVKGEVPRLQQLFKSLGTVRQCKGVSGKRNGAPARAAGNRRCQTLSQHQHPIEQVRAVRDLVTSGYDS
jgi:hypothetical protein